MDLYTATIASVRTATTTGRFMSCGPLLFRLSVLRSSITWPFREALTDRHSRRWSCDRIWRHGHCCALVTCSAAQVERSQRWISARTVPVYDIASARVPKCHQNTAADLSAADSYRPKRCFTELEELGQCIPPLRRVLPVSRYGSASHQHLVICSSVHCQPSLKISCKSVGSFFCTKLLTDRQTTTITHPSWRR